MNFSDTNFILEQIKQMGLHPNPHQLTQAELMELSKNPEIKEKFLRLFRDKELNFFQELEMTSPYVNTHRDVSYAPEQLQLHSHSFFEIIYCESGTVQYLIGDKRYRIHAGDIIMTPPGISHRPLFYDEMTEPYSRIVLWISTDFLQIISKMCSADLLSQLRAKDYFLLRTEGTPHKNLSNYFKKGVQESLDMAPLWEVALYSNTVSLLVQLGRVLISTDMAFPIEKREDLDKIISYIENNYASKITLEDTAKEFHISTSTLGKLFYHKLGISFYHFVTQRRLINSKLKIEEGSSMNEAALACGFGDYSVFYRAFKKEYGISPRDYLKLITQNIEG